MYICNSIGTKSHLSKPEIIIHATEKCLSIDKAISKIKWCLLPLGMFLKLFIRYYIGLNVVSRTNKYEIELRLVYLKIVFTNRGKLTVWFFLCYRKHRYHTFTKYMFHKFNFKKNIYLFMDLFAFAFHICVSDKNLRLHVYI